MILIKDNWVAGWSNFDLKTGFIDKFVNFVFDYVKTFQIGNL